MNISSFPSCCIFYISWVCEKNFTFFSSGWDQGVKQRKRSSFLTAILLRFTELNRCLHCPISCVLPNPHNWTAFQVHNKQPCLTSQYYSVLCNARQYVVIFKQDLLFIYPVNDMVVLLAAHTGNNSRWCE